MTILKVLILYENFRKFFTWISIGTDQSLKSSSNLTLVIQPRSLQPIFMVGLSDVKYKSILTTPYWPCHVILPCRLWPFRSWPFSKIGGRQIWKKNHFGYFSPRLYRSYTCFNIQSLLTIPSILKIFQFLYFYQRCYFWNYF